MATGAGGALEIGPADVIAEVTTSRLLGRGGAAFPTGRKWDAVARQPARPHYLVCNADESEPGTFKDRVLMESDPFALVEAMTIAGFATGCELGYLYVRGEYPLAFERVHGAIARRVGGVLGDKVMNRGSGAKSRFAGRGPHLRRRDRALQLHRGLRGEPGTNRLRCRRVSRQANRGDNVARSSTFAYPLMVARGSRNWTEQVQRTSLFCSADAAEARSVRGAFRLTADDCWRWPVHAPKRKLRRFSLRRRGSHSTGRVGHAADLRGQRAASYPRIGRVQVVDDPVDLHDLLLRSPVLRDESVSVVPCRVGTVRRKNLQRIGAGKTRGGLKTEIARGTSGRGMKDARSEDSQTA